MFMRHAEKLQYNEEIFCNKCYKVLVDEFRQADVIGWSCLAFVGFANHFNYLIEQNLRGPGLDIKLLILYIYVPKNLFSFSTKKKKKKIFSG